MMGQFLNAARNLGGKAASAGANAASSGAKKAGRAAGNEAKHQARRQMSPEALIGMLVLGILGPMIAIPVLVMFIAGSMLGGGASGASDCSTQANASTASAVALGQIPATAMQAYQRAGAATGVDWSYLAAIGYVEYKHGTYDGRHLEPNGDMVPAGFNTTGSGAAGPMQFLPGTWASYQTDGNGDGAKNVQNMFDASTAAGNLLQSFGYSGDIKRSLSKYGGDSTGAYGNEVADIAATYRGNGTLNAGNTTTVPAAATQTSSPTNAHAPAVNTGGTTAVPAVATSSNGWTGMDGPNQEEGCGAGPGAGVAARIASFNMLGCYHTDTAETYEDPGHWAAGYASCAVRVPKQLKWFEANSLTIVGVTEFQGSHPGARAFVDQYNAANGNRWGYFPKKQHGAYGQNGILWDTKEWTLVSGEEFRTDGLYNGCNGNMSSAIVQLTSLSTGGTLYVFVTHHNSDRGCRNAERRHQHRLRDLNRIKEIQASGIPVIYMGDFNGDVGERDGFKHTVCDLQASMVNAFPGGQTGTCKMPTRVGVDMIWGTPGVTFTGTAYDSELHDRKLTDHSVGILLTTVTTAASDGGIGHGAGGNFQPSAIAQVGPFNRDQLLANLNRLKAQNGTWFRRCQNFVAQMAGRSNSGYATAKAAWGQLSLFGLTHPAGSADGMAPPVGAWLYYDTGEPAGHVVTYMGNNQVASTDTWGKGTVDMGPASSQVSGPWHLKYLGWAAPWGQE